MRPDIDDDNIDDDLEDSPEDDEGEHDDSSFEDDDDDAQSLSLVQEAGGQIRIDLSGVNGRNGANGRSGRDGKIGRRLKKGGYSRGGNGTNGTAGKPGTNGRRGRTGLFTVSKDAYEVRISGPGTSAVIRGSVVIDACGGKGGNGGSGGRGGSGGFGSPSGQRGSDGAGAAGGNGGDGGSVTVHVRDAHLLAVFEHINVSGGLRGSGGSGSPSGPSGSSGEDGVVRLLCEDPRTGQVEEDDRFGLLTNQIGFEADNSWLGGNLTRGSRVNITSVTLKNTSAITVPAPFELAFSADTPLELAVQSVSNMKVSVFASRSACVPCLVGLRVRDTCDIGHYTVHVAALSRQPGVTLVLNHKKVDGLISFAVNHRLDCAALMGDNINTNELADLAVSLDPLGPEDQLAAYTAMCLAPLCGEAPLPSTRLKDLEQNLSGRLFDITRFRPRWENGPRSFTAMRAAHNFFASLPKDSREKLMDAALFIVTTDAVVTAIEKEQIRTLAEGLGLGDDWLLERMPKMLIEGDSSSKSAYTNRPATAAFLLITAFGGAGTLRLVGIHPALQAAAISTPTLTASAIFLGIFGVILIFVRKQLFRVACAICGGLDLAPVESTRRRQASLTGTGDEWRCQDCGARGTREKGHSAELPHADCEVGVPATGCMVILLLIASIGLASALILADTPIPFDASVIAMPIAFSLGAALWLPKARQAGTLGIAAVLIGVAVLIAIISAQP